ncbi:TraI domain-containing protein [Algiphilus sp.]|uniref:TraI domain-containing protein n=1 Tax=Algiphilus sp. TaxID=1872431 RepID=UPI001CA63301|nr:TraI domain-containing protein [Algiphilus acroporae]MCK5771452.1 TraI domain-containing protein [Algiphilus sp.]
MRCKASQNHHHAWPGGLLAHSMEMLPLVVPLVEATMPFERMRSHSYRSDCFCMTSKRS